VRGLVATAFEKDNFGGVIYARPAQGSVFSCGLLATVFLSMERMVWGALGIRS